MAENVQTGGLMKFHYDRGYKTPVMSDDEKREINAAYTLYKERKKREKRRKISWLILLILLIIVLISGYLIFR